MLRKKHVSVVIPVFNEENSIVGVVEKVPEFVDNIFVVDDGSVDDTLSVLDALKDDRVRVLRHIVNRGVGAATYTGLKATLDTGSDVIVTLDGDGQHDPEDTGRLVGPVMDGKADVIVGSRFLGDVRDMDYTKRLGNFALNFITKFLYGFHCSDTQSGFRAFSREAASKISITVDRYGFCSEVIGEVARHNLRLSEVPIRAIHINKQGGTNIFDGIEIVLDLIVERFRR